MSTQIDASQYLTVNETISNHGETIKLNNGVEFYSCGTSASRRGVVVLPDYYGWNSGRIRNICDFFGDNNFLAIIPRFGSTGYEVKKGSEDTTFLDWIKSLTFEGHLKPFMSAIVNHMKSQGIEKIALVGFSWGGWVAANLLACDSYSDYYCAVLVHPNLELEESLFGGSVAQLMSKVNRPFLLLADYGYPPSCRGYVDLLKYKLPTCTVSDYQNGGKDFLLRGDAVEPKVRQACANALGEMYNFINNNMNMQLSDLVHEENAVRNQPEYHEKSFIAEAKDLKANIKEKLGLNK